MAGDLEPEAPNKAGPNIKKEPIKVARPCEHPKALFMLDGEYAQLIQLLKHFNNYKMDSFDTFLLKLAAACSGTQQPCDIMRAFHILHKFYTSQTYSLTDFNNVSRPSYMDTVKDLLKDIPSVSRTVFENFLSVAEAAVSKAYTLPCVSAGWKGMGVSGPTNNRSELYDIRQTMSQWVGWEYLSLAQQDEVLRLIIEFADRLIAARAKSSSSGDGADLSALTGTPVDSEMAEVFEHLVGPLIYDVQKKGLAINRWRAVIINDPSIYKVFAQKELVKANRKKEAEQKKRPKKEGDGTQSAETGANRCCYWY